jgi:3-oxoacyl-[acyl-carrier-protein] synthase-3
MRAFITAGGQCPPGSPARNAATADHLGRLSERSEREGRLALRQNGIRSRHYAMDANGRTDWTVARLAAGAVADILDRAEIYRIFDDGHDAERPYGFRPGQHGAW